VEHRFFLRRIQVLEKVHEIPRVSRYKTAGCLETHDALSARGDIAPLSDFSSVWKEGGKAPGGYGIPSTQKNTKTDTKKIKKTKADTVAFCRATRFCDDWAKQQARISTTDKVPEITTENVKIDRRYGPNISRGMRIFTI
jgi:hypothetical protein